MQTKINNEHYSRQAYIYIRQSTMNQVHIHHESQRLQYQLADRAKGLGWSTPVIIDEDLGRSGSGTLDRPGFSRLLVDVTENKVGAIFCVEASRLARNNREWHQLIEYCALVKTLIIDLDGIYDSCNTSDRVFLGMKGTMSEYELSIFRQRAQAAIMEKANRGEFYTNIPAGFIRTDNNSCDKDPNQRVQDSFNLIFNKFRELGSANQLVLYLRNEKIEIPCRKQKGDILWKLPSVSTIKKILKNPIYAGAYVYGRTQTVIKIVDGQPRKTREKGLSIDQWKVFIKDHHPSYISWDGYLSNQKRLSENINKRGNIMKGAPKKGPALLVSLLRCRRCSQKLNVRYSSSNPGVPRYSCKGKATTGKVENCISFYGTSLEQLVTEEVLRVVQPSAISAAEKAEKLFYQNQQQKETSILNSLKQAEYEADRYFEQYNLVDPKNRLVALNLETYWNSALQQVDRIKQQLEDIRAKYQPMSEKDRKELYKLADNLNEVWNHPDIDIRFKKRILQTVIHEISVDINEDSSLTAVIHWMGGVHTEHRIKRRKRKERYQNDQQKDIKTLIKDLANVIADQDIARIFNLLKIETTDKKSWNAFFVRAFREKYNIPVFDPLDDKNKDWVNLKQAAEILGTFPETVLRMIKAKVITAQQVIKYSPWVIDKEQLKDKKILEVIKKLNNGSKNILSKDQLILKL